MFADATVVHHTQTQDLTLTPKALESSSQFGFDLLHDTSEGGLVMDGNVAQHLAINFDVGLFQTICKLAEIGRAHV